MADKSALRRSQSEAPYPSQYFSPLGALDEDTQAKSRRAAQQQGQLWRTLALFAGVLAVCLLAAWASVAGKHAPLPHIAGTAPLLPTRFGLLNADRDRPAALAEERDAVDEPEDIVEVPPATAAVQQTFCTRCSLNGACDKGGCHCAAPWTGATCAVLHSTPRGTQVAYRSSHSCSGAFPIRDSRSGIYHLFLRRTASDDKGPQQGNSIAHAVSASPGSGYHFHSIAVLSAQKTLQDPFVVYLSTSDLYLMFFSELDCNGGTGKACSQSPAVLRVAFASNLTGDWTVAATPALVGTGAGWEGAQLTSPAVVVNPDESLLLLYRGTTGIGLARAPRWTAAFERDPHNPVLAQLTTAGLFAWAAGGHYHLLGHLRPQGQAFHGYSPDGVHWALSTDGAVMDDRNVSQGTAPYSTLVDWRSRSRGGSVRRRESPALLFEAGAPTHLFTTVQLAGARGLTVISTQLVRSSATAASDI